MDEPTAATILDRPLHDAAKQLAVQLPGWTVSSMAARLTSPDGEDFAAVGHLVGDTFTLTAVAKPANITVEARPRADA